MFMKELIKAEVQAGKNHRQNLMRLLKRRFLRATQERNTGLITLLEAEWRELFPEFSLPDMTSWN